VQHGLHDVKGFRLIATQHSFTYSTCQIHFCLLPGHTLQGYSFDASAARALSSPGGVATAVRSWSLSLDEPLLSVAARDPEEVVHSSVKVRVYTWHHSPVLPLAVVAAGEVTSLHAPLRHCWCCGSSSPLLPSRDVHQIAQGISSGLHAALGLLSPHQQLLLVTAGIGLPRCWETGA
jgi:hypothetical protein